jgi:beta-mannosidase
MKGVNYIPQDVFLNRVANSSYEKLILSAADANMNMIRVWGGGVYEDERFYELCDSLGLLVWQDFMFACSMYPGDDDFLENVRLEAENNFNRISKHTSVALWCGNNENLSAWKRWGWEETAIKEQSKAIAERIWKSYDTLFHHILPSVVNVSMANKINHPTHNYWASSPSSSQAVPESYQSGDTHYWGVWWGKEPFESFNSQISSFMSEYGFQSFPAYSTFEKFATNDDKDMYSTVMNHHQRSSIGNATIEEYMQREFKKPKNFESLLYLSQLLQADGIRMGIEAHRRNKPRCMGTLYWQLNDCWPGASWSSIDYFGKWKALHYDVKKAFEPVIISHEFLDSNLHIYVVSDLLVPFAGNIEIILSELGGGKTVKKWNKEVSLKANQSAKVLIIDQYELAKAKDKSRLYIQLKLKNKSQIISEKNIFFKPFKNLKIQKPNLAYQANYNNDEKSINLKITTDNYAKGVYLTSLANANFSDNFFDLSSNEEKTIILPVAKNQNYSELIKSIEIISLWDSFN